MLRIRRKLGEYQEIFYMIFLLAMTGMTSMGLNSHDKIYMYVFAVATLFLLLKMAVTDFTWREILIMGVFTLLLGINFLRNGEKTLILTAMGIFGAKNVNLDRVLRYALWEKAVLTIGTLTLAATGVIENVALELPKRGELFTIYCYGYETANMAFANIFVLLLLAIMVYGEKLKWYFYVVGTGIMLVAYEVFMCRTGILAWFLLCIMVICTYIAKRVKWDKIYMRLYALIPIVLAAVTIIIPAYARVNPQFSTWINTLLTGRVMLVDKVYDQIWTLWLGHVPAHPFDSMYFNTVYNYGWIIFMVYLIVYIVGIWYNAKRERPYVVVALGIMAVYGYMELLPLSVLWNLPLLYLSTVLFKGERTNEQL